MVSSHLLSEVEVTADEVIVIARGDVLYAGGIADLAGGTAAVEFDVDGSAETAATVRRLIESRGWHLESGGRRRGGSTSTVTGATLAELSGALADAGVAVRRIQDQGSLEDAYARLTAGRSDFVGH